MESAILQAKAHAFERILIIGSDAFAAEVDPSTALEQLEQYETQLEQMLKKYPEARVLCPYTSTIVSPDMLLQAVSTHACIRTKNSTHVGNIS